MIHFSLYPLAIPCLVELVISSIGAGWSLKRLYVLILSASLVVGADLLGCRLGAESLIVPTVLLTLGLFTAISALGEPRFCPMLRRVFWAWTFFFAVASWFGFASAEHLFPLSYVCMANLFIVTSQLAHYIERVRQVPLSGASDGGVSQDFPAESGLILVGLLLLGSAPGSLLFVIEDIAMGQVFDHSFGIALGMAAVIVIQSIACYRAFVLIFHGRGQADRDTLRINPTIPLVRLVRLVLGLTIVIGLWPQLIV